MTVKNTILAIDAATGACSVALWHEGHIAAYLENQSGSRQSALLLPMVEQALAQAGLTYESLSGIACTIGPGSFTGIRVGLAAASGICFAARKPGLGFTTLETVAYGALLESEDQPVLAIINAGKGEVYYQAFDSGDFMALYEPRLGTLDAALATVPATALIAGNMEAPGYRKAAIAFPRADALAALAARGGGGALLPYYIRDPDAKPMTAL